MGAALVTICSLAHTEVGAPSFDLPDVAPLRDRWG
jgi:hypothetical protein